MSTLKCGSYLLLRLNAATTLAPVTSSALRKLHQGLRSPINVQHVSAALSTSTKTVSQRSLHRAFHVIEQLDVRITDDFELDIRDCNDPVVVSDVQTRYGVSIESSFGRVHRRSFPSNHVRRMIFPSALKC